MSHTTSIKGIKIVSVTALRAAAAELAANGIKCRLVDNAKPRSYYSQFGKEQPGMGQADHVLILDDSKYDIGFYKQEDGTYEPRTDFWNGEVTKVLGVPATSPDKQAQAQLGKLFQAYSIHATMEVAKRQGKTVRRITGKDGAVKLEITGY